MAFKRIDAEGKGGINSLDLVQLFRENNKVIPEADTYMLINCFDSNNDGKLSLIDFQKMVAPTNYSNAQHKKATKKQYIYALDNSLTSVSYDVELGIIRICEKEIQSMRNVETFKQELLSFQDFSLFEIFRHID